MARAQRERTDARAEADDLRSDLAQARRVGCDARDEVAALQRTLDEHKLQMDELRREVEDLRAQAKEASEARESFATEAHELKQAPRFTTRLSCDDRAEFESHTEEAARRGHAPEGADDHLASVQYEALEEQPKQPRKVLGRALDAARAAARFQKQQRPSLGETDQDEVTAAPGWDAMGTRRASDDPELADHLARRDKAIAMGLVDAPPDEWMEEERPEEPETEAERKLRELEERAFDGAAVQDEEAAPWPRAESLAQSAAPWNHARQRDRAARGLPPPAPLPLEIPEPSDHTTQNGERTPGAPRPDPQATIDATAAYLQMRRDRARDKRAARGGDAAAAGANPRATTTPRRATRSLEDARRGHVRLAAARRRAARRAGAGAASRAAPAGRGAEPRRGAQGRRPPSWSGRSRLVGVVHWQPGGRRAACRTARPPASSPPRASAGGRGRGGRRRAACGSPSATRGRASTAAARAPRAARRRRRRRRRRRACSEAPPAPGVRWGGRVSARRRGPAPMSRQRGGAGQSAEP